MNLRNHTTPLYWPLTGENGEEPMYTHNKTYKFNLKDVPATTRRMCNYLAGVLVSVVVAVKYKPGSGDPEYLDGSDVARGLFESAEVQQTMFGTPVSPNHYLGKYFGLFEFVANGLRAVSCPPAPVGNSTSPRTHTYEYFVPLSALLGMKGHHTAQPAVCYDRAQLILRTAQAGAVHGLEIYGAGGNTGNVLRVSAVLIPEPELRLGPGTSFMRYTAVASSSGTIVSLDGLGNNTTLEGAEPGAGLAWLAAMANGKRQFGGAFSNAGDVEYLQASFRDIMMTRNLDPFISDWQCRCGATNMPYVDDDIGPVSLPGGGHAVGYLFSTGVHRGDTRMVQNAEFLPIITPAEFVETSKMQVVQGTQSVGIKHITNGFTGEHVFCALQYHSWTPAKQEDVLRKLVDSGVAMTVWGTNKLVPKVKVTNKQNPASINPAKTRFFATTWEPAEVVSTPPSVSA